MKKKKYIFLTLMLFLLNIQPTSAACTEEEINNFKKIEDKYTVKYEFENTSKTYTMYFDNPNPENYGYQIYSEVTLNCTVLENNKTKCINFPSGDYDIEIKGKTSTCNDILKKLKITLPKYNKLSEDPLCEGIEEFVLCSPTYEKEIEYDTFVSRVNTYKKTKQKKEHPKLEEEKEQKKDFFDNEIINNIISYIKENWIEIIIIGIFIILVIITTVITVKAIRKSRRLE